MGCGRIDAALRESNDTRCVAISAGAVTSVGDVFAQHFGDRPVIVVADDNTFQVAGRVVNQRLQAAGRNVVEPFVFPSKPVLYADYERVVELEAILRARDAIPVAVGSGTLNDITKLAAQLVGRPYMAVATAASVDGYTAPGAGITRNGFKQTLACPAPRVVVADLDILTEAPAEMTAAGYADLLGKVTAGADWIIADAVGIEPIDARAWSRVQDSLRDWTGEPELLHRGDRRAIACLTEGLMMSGLAMQAAQSSRPASGSEHQFSHLWEMEGLGNRTDHVSHGFKVGIGTIAVAALYERILASDLSNLDVASICRAWPTRADVERTVRGWYTVPAMAEKAIEESLAKYVDDGGLAQRLTVIQECWPVLRDRLTTQLMTVVQLRDSLQAAGCPVEPADIGVDLPRLKSSYYLARQIRRRYTVLDLAGETGVLSGCVDALFAAEGVWPRHHCSLLGKHARC